MSSLTERLRAKRARIVGPILDWHPSIDPLVASADREAHYVYRIYDADGVLLYIGCTYDLWVRINQHYDGSPFNLQMAYWTGWRYPDRRTALAAEAAAIGDEAPEWNVLHQRPHYWP